jgi:hypothetical protein
MSTGQGVGAVIGATIGFFVGGPVGAFQGASIGASVGGALDPPKGPTIQGPRLNDLTVQTSTYGQFIPRTYGTIGLSGNVFWLENNALKEVVKKKKSGGKGGGSSSKINTYTYFATFAIGLCEGPIAGVRRIWVGPDLIYDAGSDDLETIISSNSATSGFSIYLGADTQQPDPRIQAEMGVANCPAYRGLAYIVMKDLALEKYGNSVAGAQVRVEVVNSLSSVGFRKVLDVTSGVIFSTIGAPGAGRPYIDAAAGYAIVTAGSAGYLINSAGIYQSPASGRFLNAKSVNVFYSGYLDSGDQLSINVTGATFSYFDSSVLFDIPQASIAGKKIHGLTVSANGSYIFAIFSAASLGSSINDGIYFLMNSSGGVIRTGGVNLSILPSVFTFGFGRTAQYHYAASCVSNDGKYIYTAYGAGTQQVDRYELNSNIENYTQISGGIASSTAFSYPGIFEDGGLVYVAVGQKFYHFVSPKKITEQAVSLSSIVATEAASSSLIKPADIDTTGLTDAVTGFKVTATGSIRNAIEPLRGAWPFDVVQSGYQIKATSRGSASVATIPVGELAIDTQLTESREMDSQLPQNVTVKYIDQGRDYDVNEQRAQRDNTEAVNSLSIDLPVVLSASEAAQVADKLIRIYALEKSDFSFTLPAPYRYLEPGDVITIATDDADFVLRLVSVNHTADGRLECAGRPSSASTYVSIAPGAPGQGGSVTIPLAGATISTLIDCPVIDEGLQDAPGFALAFNGYSSGWPGGILYQSADEGQTWTDLQAITAQCTSGTATNFLSISAGNLVQLGGSLTVSLIAGTLESVTQAQMFNGSNIAAYGQPGRWEIIRFQNATLVSAGVYALDTFWRGDRGTEWATGLHVAGDQFILMTDPDLAFVGIPTDTIGQPRIYRSITAGADIDSAADQAFTYAGVNLETYSGVHPVGSRSANDLTIAWKRRTRVGGAWRDNVDASLGETVQAYEVDIMQGAVVKRTLAASTPSVLYTSAMQVTDFGSNQSSVAVNIYQLSSVVGRGYSLGATL